VHVVVVGCGRVGSSLAINLSEAGHSVAVVDKRSEAFSRLGSGFKGQTLVGIGFDRDRLLAAGIERAGAVASVTSGDNSNILVARVARETFGIERVVARIYDPRRAAIYQRLGIATVATVAWTTERVLRRILPETPAVEWVDPSANVSLVERSVGSRWAGHRVGELEEERGLKIVALSRLGVAQIPAPSLVVQDGDVLYLAVSGDALADLDERLSGPRVSGKGH
jgi:trk system potassium uptake protein TrkA